MRGTNGARVLSFGEQRGNEPVDRYDLKRPVVARDVCALADRRRIRGGMFDLSGDKVALAAAPSSTWEVESPDGQRR